MTQSFSFENTYGLGHLQMLKIPQIYIFALSECVAYLKALYINHAGTTPNART